MTKTLFHNYLIIFIFFLLFTSCQNVKNDNTSLKVGVTSIDITPPTGYPVHRVPSEGFFDPIKIKTLVLTQEKDEFAFVTADLFYIDYDLANIARKLASEKTGIPVSNICISATHTHADPSYADDFAVYFKKYNEGTLSADDENNYAARIIKEMARSVDEAKGNQKTVTMQTGVAKTSEIVFNRRHLMRDGSVIMNGGLLNPDIIRAVGPVDPDLSFVLFTDENNKPFASLTTFAMQTATIGGTKKFSGGYPHFIEMGLKNKFGDDFISLFAEGTCADVNHWDITKPGPQIGYEEVTKPIGEKLALTILNKLPEIQKGTPSLGVRSTIINVPLQMYSQMDLEWAKSYTGDPPNSIVRTRAKRILHLDELRNRFGENIPMEIQVIRLSDETAIVTLPGQVFVELGLALKKASPFQNTIIITLANNHEECIPLRKAYTEGSYEIIYSRVEAGAGEQIIETALSLLKELKK